jgi:hypothetical protein
MLHAKSHKHIKHKKLMALQSNNLPGPEHQESNQPKTMTGLKEKKLSF